MRNFMITIIVIAIVILVASCSRPNGGTTQTTQESLSTDYTESFTVTTRENAFYITVYDNKHSPFEELGPFPKEPIAKRISDSIMLVELQAGSGKETKWGVYYDLVEHRQSERFYGILAETEDTVVYCGVKQVIMQDIFDKSLFFQAFSDFPTELSPTATPFISAVFTNGGKDVMITYLSGSDYHSESITISLLRSQ